MPIKLIEIKGLMIDKESCISMCHSHGGYACTCGAQIRNQAIDEQSVRAIGINREKLALILKNYFGKHSVTSKEKKDDEMAMRVNQMVDWWMTYGLSDLIISSEKDLIEYQEGSK